MADLAASGVELKVTPRQLIDQSHLVERRVNTMRRQFEHIKTLVNKSEGCWKGEAADQYRRMYREQAKNVERVLNRLAEHPVDLRTIASRYIQAEDAAEQIIEALPGDVLQ